MSRFKHKGWLLAGLTLIVLSNAWVLGSVAYNRSGEPQSVLLLSERELRPMREWERRDNSGVALWPQVRTEERPNAIKWTSPPLSAQSMRQLGFELPAEDDDKALARFERAQSRPALLVLEMDGAAYQASVAARRERLSKAEAELARFPTDETRQQALQAARKELRQELDEASRLFLIDAGPDAAQLRQRYPDRQRYWLVRGAVAPWVRRRDGNRPPEVGGTARDYQRYLQVPYAWRHFWQDGTDPVHYAVEVYVGQRFEPWINWISVGSRATDKDDASAAQR
ncbi:DUF4824 family protein [Pseudomonas mangrovi]|uniref:DUF4824 domain-containing protein n=1 Tax=Pseudomonas mangrovi TaxID=2161748 RepID=A0A2T5PEJ0_9PSED|nr:DUF4824 family protein [Pseudomonas mangrovi]PTU76149.1 DUF4824 domain-containing protein [Pseudomonas mangrovi]